MQLHCSHIIHNCDVVQQPYMLTYVHSIIYICFVVFIISMFYHTNLCLRVIYLKYDEALEIPSTHSGNCLSRVCHSYLVRATIKRSLYSLTRIIAIMRNRASLWERSIYKARHKERTCRYYDINSL